MFHFYRHEPPYTASKLEPAGLDGAGLGMVILG